MRLTHVKMINWCLVVHEELKSFHYEWETVVGRGNNLSNLPTHSHSKKLFGCLRKIMLSLYRAEDMFLSWSDRLFKLPLTVWVEFGYRIFFFSETTAHSCILTSRSLLGNVRLEPHFLLHHDEATENVQITKQKQDDILLPKHGRLWKCLTSLTANGTEDFVAWVNYKCVALHTKEIFYFRNSGSLLLVNAITELLTNL